jgi:hypothetical protein
LSGFPLALTGTSRITVTVFGTLFSLSRSRTSFISASRSGA